jgi:hypothetical protein
MTTYFPSGLSTTWSSPSFGAATTSFGGSPTYQPGFSGAIGTAPSSTPTPSYGSSGGAPVLPIIGGILGAVGSIAGAAMAGDATRDAAAQSAAATKGAARIAGKYGIKRDKLDYELQQKAKEASVFRFDPAQRALMASFAASPAAQKLSAQEFYNQRALAGTGGGFSPLAGGSPFYRI